MPRAAEVVKAKGGALKNGLTKTQLFEVYETMKNKGVKKFGLHTLPITSNELRSSAFVETANMLFDLMRQTSEKLKNNIQVRESRCEA